MRADAAVCMPSVMPLVHDSQTNFQSPKSISVVVIKMTTCIHLRQHIYTYRGARFACQIRRPCRGGYYNAY